MQSLDCRSLAFRARSTIRKRHCSQEKRAIVSFHFFSPACNSCLRHLSKPKQESLLARYPLVHRARSILRERETVHSLSLNAILHFRYFICFISSSRLNLADVPNYLPLSRHSTTIFRNLAAEVGRPVFAELGGEGVNVL